MPYRNPISNRLLAGLMTGVVAFATIPAARAGSATGAATEWTQLANNAQLIDLLKSSGIQVDNQITQIGQLAEQIQNQLKIYETCCRIPRSFPTTSGDRSREISTA